VPVLVPKVTLVEGNAMTFQKLTNLLLEREFAVMLGLVVNVGGDSCYVRFTHRKGAVAILPSETVDAFFF
jgi:hypothetical protein